LKNRKNRPALRVWPPVAGGYVLRPSH